MNKELYPELLDYIFNYCGKHFWQKELLAHKHLHALAKSNNGVNVMMYKFFMKETIVTNDKDIQNLIAGGFDIFRIKVATRIYNEHKNELELNLCPKCSKIARTPQSKQCRFCLHDWH